jgi:hypothetical protein
MGIFFSIFNPQITHNSIYENAIKVNNFLLWVNNVDHLVTFQQFNKIIFFLKH